MTVLATPYLGRGKVFLNFRIAVSLLLANSN